MKCDYIQQHLSDLFDDQVSETDRRKLLLHVGQCENCREAYADFNYLGTALKQEMAIMDQEQQSQTIMDAIKAEELSKLKGGIRIVFYKRTLRIAASVMLFVAIGAGIIFLITYRKSAFAAGRVLDNSIQIMAPLNSVCMVFSVRTSADENFESIDPAAGFVDFKVSRIFGTATKWRFEKPGRTIIMDGKDQYLVNEHGGYVLKGSPKAGFVGWMRMFLEPMKVLEAERSFARDHHDSYTIREIGGLVEVSVTAAALGNFDNPYALNASIAESTTRRVYSFDRQTYMLRSLAVYLTSGQEDICILKLSSVRINLQLSDSLFVFSNQNNRPLLTLEAYEKATSNGLKDISSTEAARIFFTACAKNDWRMVERFSPLFSIAGGMAIKAVRDRFASARLLQTGRSFISGLYAGEFVPYTIQTKSGDTLTGNLALRNDNPYHAWIVDGGY